MNDLRFRYIGISSLNTSLILPNAVHPKIILLNFGLSVNSHLMTQVHELVYYFYVLLPVWFISLGTRFVIILVLEKFLFKFTL